MFFDRNISNRRVMFNSGPLDAQSILVACLPHHIFLSSFSLLGVDIDVINSCLQLRNLLWATSKHDVYFMQNYSVMHWSALLRRGKEVLNVAKPIIPTLVRSHLVNQMCFFCTQCIRYECSSVLMQTHPGFLAQPVSRVQISTMTVKENLMVAGGFQGELICKVGLIIISYFHSI